MSVFQTCLTFTMQFYNGLHSIVRQMSWRFTTAFRIHCNKPVANTVAFQGSLHETSRSSAWQMKFFAGPAGNASRQGISLLTWFSAKEEIKLLYLLSGQRGQHLASIYLESGDFSGHCVCVCSTWKGNQKLITTFCIWNCQPQSPSDLNSNHKCKHLTVNKDYFEITDGAKCIHFVKFSPISSFIAVIS